MQVIQLQPLRPQRTQAQAPLQQVHLFGQCLGLGTVVVAVQLIPVLGHQPRLQLGRQGRLRSILRGIGVDHFLCFKGVDRRLGRAPPGFLHFLMQALVRALGHPAQQYRQCDAGADQRQQDHPGSNENQQVTLREDLARPHQQRHRHHTRQGHRTAHTAQGQQPAGTRRRHQHQRRFAAPAAHHTNRPPDALHPDEPQQDQRSKDRHHVQAAIGQGRPHGGFVADHRLDDVRQLQAQQQENQAIEGEFQ
ncbi:hypothetical protein D3C76_1182370 [compost metagenome]